MQLHFTKMEGCGNDYVYVNGFTQHVPQEEKPALARRLSDRHFGVGGDGVIFINPSDIADFEMEMYNADGSRGEMCGNGIRCVGKYVYDRGMTGGRTIFTVESCGKIKVLELACKGGKALTVRVNMGAPILRPAEIPVISVKNTSVPKNTEIPENTEVLEPTEVLKNTEIPACSAGRFSQEDLILSQPIGVGGRIWRVTCVSMGNPHAVIFLTKEEIKEWHERDCADRSQKADSGEAGAPSLWDLDLSGIGPLFENHSRFPNRINTEFVQVVDRRHVKMRVWERGTGETLACGTGACAAVVAGVMNGFTDRRTEVELSGGILLIEWEEGMGDVYLTGPAKEVFEGSVYTG